MPDDFDQDVDRGPACGARFVPDPRTRRTVNRLLNPTMMAEATRLVRAGRLAESTALLQRLSGTTAPDTASAVTTTLRATPPHAAADHRRRVSRRGGDGCAARAPRHRCATGGRIGRYGRKSSAAPAPAARLARSHQAPLRARTARADATGPGAARPIWCREADSSSKRSTATRREAAPTSSTSPAAIADRPCRWS